RESSNDAGTALLAKDVVVDHRIHRHEAIGTHGQNTCGAVAAGVALPLASPRALIETRKTSSTGDWPASVDRRARAECAARSRGRRRRRRRDGAWARWGGEKGGLIHGLAASQGGEGGGEKPVRPGLAPPAIPNIV